VIVVVLEDSRTGFHLAWPSKAVVVVAPLTVLVRILRDDAWVAAVREWVATSLAGAANAPVPFPMPQS